MDDVAGDIDFIRRMFDEFGWSPAGIEAASRAGLVAPDVELDFSALYLAARRRIQIQ